MNNLVAFFLSLVAKLGPLNAKIEEVWPHIKIIGQECEHILTILNGGKPVIHAGPPSGEGSKLVNSLVSAGVTRSEAEKAVNSIESLAGRL